MVSKRKTLSFKERVDLAKESQASDILKCKEIFDEFDSNILEVLTGFYSALQRYQFILILLNKLHTCTSIELFAKKRLQIQKETSANLDTPYCTFTGIQIGLKVHNNDDLV